ncbi:YggS family pyridoxal phosphate-dependent enzyme [Marinilongibacter aquaticus]|uniref:YggS family pyridoxal phosphate-dependent enzyme n=1 Tax=Marinilongibacter aquaticus TaxID=2975157 RepID=UPI0021BD2DBF|nr:YggS family pyridoxal phosphate-dependent enzyme [Marinilongibacter aquaticus]UBM57929.1 YggS family pyridoxal phosphate-dependent enzyme [Marinilongibacter aquaticus]
MHEIGAKIAEIEQKIKNKAHLVAVSKRQSNEKIMEAYRSGFKRFGENYVQELVGKAEELPKDIEWHMIGHLQSNKVKYIAPFVSLIHSVDSFKLLKEINKQAKKFERTIPCLLQVHIAEEDTKTGLNFEELDEILESHETKNLENIEIRGLMGMSSLTDDTRQVAEEFKSLKAKFDQINNSKNYHLTELSMGMSGDWPLAIEMGSTLIRVGSAIFGTRS